MKKWWSRLFADTLSKRLFLLLWGTLVLSHLLGFWLTHPGEFQSMPGFMPGPPGSAPSGLGVERNVMPPFLPPGAMGEGPRRPADRASGVAPGRQGDGALRNQQPWMDRGLDGMRGPGGPGGPFREPFDPQRFRRLIWLDYLVRVLVLGVGAWLGARWLTAPMRKLARATQSLSGALVRKADLPLLDEDHGPQEMRQTSQVFNDMARGLREQFEQRGLMMAAVSHDLRTPLTRLRMRLENLQPHPDAARCIQDVQDIDAMIAAVLDAMNEERRQEAPALVDVLSLVQAMADDLQETGQPVTADGDEATVRVQPIAFKRVLSNLVSNALRYGQSADIRVTVAPGPAHGTVRITVDDRGPGIPEAQLEAVFKPFFRLESSRSRDTGGVGLGLYIARELTQRQGGTLKLMNRDGGGLRAELVLPAAGA